jgi:hypothetical protein
MSTRAQIRFATREDGVSFSEHPEKINAQFYKHSDGYPEGLGVEIAECFSNYGKINNWEIEDLCARHGDLEYIYYVWQEMNKTTWISIFEVSGFGYDTCETCGREVPLEDKCIFVGRPEKLIEKYKENTNDDG